MAASNEKVRMFISYSHADEKQREEFQKYLVMFERAGLIDVWHDRLIRPGQEWDKKISENLKSADLIVLLISQDFIFSSYCYDIEMTAAVSMHDNGDAVVVPIILDHATWEDAPFGKLQAVPKNARPLSEFDNPSKGWVEIYGSLKNVIEEICQKKSNSRLANPSIKPSVALAVAPFNEHGKHTAKLVSATPNSFRSDLANFLQDELGAAVADDPQSLVKAVQSCNPDQVEGVFICIRRALADCGASPSSDVRTAVEKAAAALYLAAAVVLIDKENLLALINAGGSNLIRVSPIDEFLSALIVASMSGGVIEFLEGQSISPRMEKTHAFKVGHVETDKPERVFFRDLFAALRPGDPRVQEILLDGDLPIDAKLYAAVIQKIKSVTQVQMRSLCVTVAGSQIRNEAFIELAEEISRKGGVPFVLDDDGFKVGKVLLGFDEANLIEAVREFSSELQILGGTL